jgi:hypothetical protein
MSPSDRCPDAVIFLRNLDEDWARATDPIGRCLHDPKGARKPYTALIRAIAFQQLTAKEPMGALRPRFSQTSIDRRQYSSNSCIQSFAEFVFE